MLPNASTVFFRNFRYEFNENGGNVYENDTLALSTAGQNTINRVILAIAEVLNETREQVKDLERALKHEIQCVESCKEELSKKGYYDQLNEKMSNDLIEMNKDLFTRLKNAENANIMLQKENLLLRDGLTQSEKDLEEARGEIYKLQEAPPDSNITFNSAEEKHKFIARIPPPVTVSMVAHSQYAKGWNECRRTMLEPFDWRLNKFIPTNRPCHECGKVFMTGIEPRFGYVVCEQHSHVAPATIKE